MNSQRTGKRHRGRDRTDVCGVRNGVRRASGDGAAVGFGPGQQGGVGVCSALQTDHPHTGLAARLEKAELEAGASVGKAPYFFTRDKKRSGLTR